MNPSSGQADGVAFKTCQTCDHTWNTRDSFLNDPGLKLIGYQVYFEDLTAGLFLFSHSCKETLTVRVGDFSDLYDSIVFADRATGSEECRGYCFLEHELRPCPAACECAYVRELIQIIRAWDKSGAHVSIAP